MSLVRRSCTSCAIADSQLAPEDEADGIEVAWEDQQKINTFSKLNNRLGDLRDQLKAKEVRFAVGAREGACGLWAAVCRAVLERLVQLSEAARELPTSCALPGAGLGR